MTTDDVIESVRADLYLPGPRAVAIEQRAGGWVLYLGEERIGWFADFNSAADLAESRGFERTDSVSRASIRADADYVNRVIDR